MTLATIALPAWGRRTGLFEQGSAGSGVLRAPRPSDSRGDTVSDDTARDDPAAKPTRADLELFVSEHYPRVVATVAMITGDRQNAADAVQDALVGYLASPPTATIENLPAWITTVASRRLRDGHRRRAAESRAFAKVGVSPDAIEDASALLDVDLRRAIEALPERQRRILALHYLLDLSVDDVAAASGVTSGTVKTQLFRARAKLAAALRPVGEELAS